MDDFRRAIWMQIRTEVQTSADLYVCNQLKSWMRRNGVLPYFGIICEEEQAILEEFFPELGKLADGIIWDRSGTGARATGIDSCPPWFEMGWKEPRLALIDHILTSTT